MWLLRAVLIFQKATESSHRHRNSSLRTNVHTFVQQFAGELEQRKFQPSTNILIYPKSVQKWPVLWLIELFDKGMTAMLVFQQTVVVWKYDHS